LSNEIVEYKFKDVFPSEYLGLICDDCPRDCILFVIPQGEKKPTCPMGNHDPIWRRITGTTSDGFITLAPEENIRERDTQ